MHVLPTFNKSCWCGSCSLLQLRECSFADSDIQVNEQSTTSHPPECGDTPNARQQPLAKVPAAEDNGRTMYEALQIVRRKIIRMASQLSDDTAIDETVKLCEAIKSCAECATAMQRLV